ncbi:MAG: putative porin [Woeseiaceae bacterium]
MSTLRAAAVLAAILHSVIAPAQEDPANLADSVSVSGDLRLRYEMIREDEEEDRNRARFRGRVGIGADLSEDVRLFFGLATGGGDPVSTNQTFGEGFSTKDIGVNLAYAEWSINDRWQLTAGKMEKPWYRVGGTPLVWDSDLNPEGLVIAYQDGRFFGSAGSFIVVERSDESETRLNTLQAGLTLPFSETSSLTAVIALFDYTNVIGQAPFHDGPEGNTVDAVGNYVFDYNELEVGLQYDMLIGNWPLIIFGEYVQNTEVDREDTGWSAGVVLGRAKGSGTMQFGWAWQDTGADAVNSTYNDSDFADGVTDADGHYLRARYNLREAVSLNGTFILSEFGGFTGTARDYSRIMLDLQLEF